MLIRDIIGANKPKNLAILSLGVVASVLLSMAAGAGRSKEPLAAEEKINSIQADVKTYINSDPGSKVSANKASLAGENKSVVKVNGESFDLNKDGIIQKVIRDKGGQTYVYIENNTDANGSSANLTVNSSATSANSSSHVQAQSSFWSSP